MRTIKTQQSEKIERGRAIQIMLKPTVHFHFTVPRGRIELPTRRFSVFCSTTELPRQRTIGGQCWTRTSDLLGVNEALSPSELIVPIVAQDSQKENPLFFYSTGTEIAYQKYSKSQEVFYQKPGRMRPGLPFFGVYIQPSSNLF